MNDNAAIQLEILKQALLSAGKNNLKDRDALLYIAGYIFSDLNELAIYIGEIISD